MPSPRNVTCAEAVAAGALAFFAAPVVGAYLIDRAGLPFLPAPMAIVAPTIALAVYFWLRRGATRGPAELIALVGLVVVAFAWLLWLARPDFLPIGTGVDLTHHLLLIDFIERRWRLVHDASVETYLGEMVQYTPGSQILAALAGRWAHSDGLHAVHPIVALSTALKMGFVFLTSLRLVPRERAQAPSAAIPRIPLAMTAVVLLLLPHTYLLGSFIRDSFFAQVVSELFAVAMWWALVAWDDEPTAQAAAIFAFAGIAAFLTWPVWVAAPLVALAAVMAMRTDVDRRQRARHFAIATVPILTIAGIYVQGRIAWVGIVRTGGTIVRPALEEYGWWFLALSLAGTMIAATVRRGRATVLFLAAIGFEAAALYVVARTRGSVESPYLALKMFYLAIYPQAAVAALAIATAWQRVSGTTFRTSHPFLAGQQATAWVLVAALAVLSARPLFAETRKPVVSEDLYRAGLWAREHAPPGCVDYLVGDDYAAYWLHLAVLRNPRMSARTGDNDTYVQQKAIVRWLTPIGLPYAIAELPSLPRDVRTDLDIVADFGSAAVVKRRGPAVCRDTGQPPIQ